MSKMITYQNWINITKVNPNINEKCHIVIVDINNIPHEMQEDGDLELSRKYASLTMGIMFRWLNDNINSPYYAERIVGQPAPYSHNIRMYFFEETDYIAFTMIFPNNIMEK